MQFLSHSGRSLHGCRFYQDKFSIPFVPLGCPARHTRKIPWCVGRAWDWRRFPETSINLVLRSLNLLQRKAHIGAHLGGGLACIRAGLGGRQATVFQENSERLCCLSNLLGLTEELPTQPSTALEYMELHIQHIGSWNMVATLPGWLEHVSQTQKRFSVNRGIIESGRKPGL